MEKEVVHLFTFKSYHFSKLIAKAFFDSLSIVFIAFLANTIFWIKSYWASILARIVWIH